MGRAPLVAAAAVAGLALVTSPARATTVLPLSLVDLAERSDVAAHVRVGPVRVVATDQAPFRVTQLEVLEVLQGQARAGDVLELWQRGDGYVFVVGDPWLQTGEEGLAFLVRRGQRTHLTALAQSWWRIEEGRTGGPIARRDLSGLHVLQRGGGSRMPPNELSWPLLRQRVLDTIVGVSR